MKRLVLSVLVLFATIINAGSIPEFDGAYIETKDGGFIELTEVEGRDGVRGSCHNGEVGVFVEPDNFKSIYIKGNYEYKHLSFHAAGWTKDLETICKRRQEIKIKTKSKTNSTTFEPRENLTEGFYVVWIGKRKWFFEVADKKTRAIREKAKLAEENKHKMKLWNSKEIFTDVENNLVWQDSYLKKFDLASVKKHCEDLEFAQNKDWRLPSEGELKLLSYHQNQTKSLRNGWYWCTNGAGGHDDPYLMYIPKRRTKVWYGGEKFVRCVSDKK